MKKNYSDRKWMVIGIFLIIGFIFIARLYYVQIVEEKYRLSANSNVIRRHTIYPARGIMYD